ESPDQHIRDGDDEGAHGCCSSRTRALGFPPGPGSRMIEKGNGNGCTRRSRIAPGPFSSTAIDIGGICAHAGTEPTSTTSAVARKAHVALIGGNTTAGRDRPPEG